MKKHYLPFVTTLLLVLGAPGVRAQVVNGNGFLKQQYIEAGIQANGAFGSTVPAPADYFYHNNTYFGGRLGFISDVGKDGWTVGSPAYIGDYFLPGSPYEGFSVTINGTRYLNSGVGDNDIPGSITGFSTTDASQSVQWTGTINGLKIVQVATVQTGKSFILVKVTVTNTTTSAINNLYYTREVDPDNEVTEGGDYTTNNVIEKQNPNSTSTALISAHGLNFGSYLGLGSADCRARVAVPGGWPDAQGDNIWAGTGTALHTPGNVTDDAAMSLAFNIGNLAAGASNTVTFAYVLNASDLPVAMDLTSPDFNISTSTYSSGATVPVCSGQQATMKIENGDGFSWTWSPSTGLDQTTGTVVKATLSGTATYTASGVDACGSSKTMTVTLNPTITAAPDDAGTISGPTKLTSGATVGYSVPAITGADSYNWTIPSGATFVSGYNTNSIQVNFGPAATGGTISVSGANACGMGASSSLVAKFDSLPAPISESGNPTSNKKPLISGKSVPNATVTIYDGTTVLGTATAGADSAYTFTPASDLSVGMHSISVSAPSGSGTIPSMILKLQIVNAPPKPAAPALASGSSPVNSNEPPLKGTATANTTVTIFVDGTSIGTTTADASGNWTYTPESPIADGPHDITITATDGSGNASAASNALALTIDTAPPAAPSEPALVSGSSPISNSQPALSGTAEANSTVTVYVDGTSIGTATADGSGNWNFTPTSPIADGPHDITVIATDAAGNSSTAGDALALTIDTTPPAQPATPGLENGRSPINVTTPVLKGTAEANSKVTVYIDGIAATVTADADGNWSYTPDPALTEGDHLIKTTATDAAGNTSDYSAEFALTVDLTAPEASSTPKLVSGYTPLKNNKPEFSGTAEANSTVTIYVDGKVIGATQADANGKWSYTAESVLADGPRTISTTVTDAAGNTSVKSADLALVIDTKPPVLTLSTPLNVVNTAFQVKITIPEGVVGFSASGLTISNAILKDFTMISPSEYVATIAPISENPVAVYVAAGVTADTAGNQNVASQVLQVQAEFNALVSNVYPNPGNGVIHIQLDGIVPAQAKVMLTSLSGQVVLTRDINFVGSMVTLDATGLPDATYLLLVQAKTYTYRTKIRIIR